MMTNKTETLARWLHDQYFEDQNPSQVEIAAFQPMATALLQTLEPVQRALELAKGSMDHAIVFIRTREKMHPAGIELHREDLLKIRDALATLSTLLGEKS